MPFPFVLSTTSQITSQSSLTSSTHPSLPSAATSQRAILKSTLKSFKRSSPADQSNSLPTLVQSLNGYLKYLLSLDLALSGKPVSGEDIDIALVNEIEVEWRPTLSLASIPGRENDRVKGRGLDFELYFVLHTLALVQNLQARQSLLGLYASSSPNTELRLSLIVNATKALRNANAIHSHLCYKANTSGDGPPPFPIAAADISTPVQSALKNLTHAEINLLGVLKDDPYPAVVVQSRNKDDKEWMIKAPQIPKVRTQVLRRLCIGAAELTASACAALKGEGRKVSKDWIDYCDDVRRTARAKACRFAALDADLSGKTGEGIAWLRAGMSELGMDVSKDGSKSGGFSKLKASWTETREDKRIQRGSSDWGADGGKLEEGRILEYLDRKFTKENDTINVQLVPEWRPLLATMPSGMNIPVDNQWTGAVLSEIDLAAMRAPPEDGDLDDASTDEDDDSSRTKGHPSGAFPGMQHEYRGTSATNYY